MKKKQAMALLLAAILMSGSINPITVRANETTNTNTTESTSKTEQSKESEDEQSNTNSQTVTDPAADPLFGKYAIGNYPDSQEGAIYNIVFSVITGELAITKTTGVSNETRLTRLSTYKSQADIDERNEVYNKLNSFIDDAINAARVEYGLKYMKPGQKEMSAEEVEACHELENQYINKALESDEYKKLVDEKNMLEYKYSDYDVYISIADYFVRGLYTTEENWITTKLCRAVWDYCDTGNTDKMQEVANVLVMTSDDYEPYFNPQFTEDAGKEEISKESYHVAYTSVERSDYGTSTAWDII